MIFVSGIHGVGKTYFCNMMGERLGIKAYSASELIAEKSNQVMASDKQVMDVIHYLMANPAERLDMHEASRRCGLSYYAFSRFFHEMTGMGYAEYGNLIRIRHTEELLIYSDMSVEEISRAVGMSSANYYTRLFKKVNGMSPTKYRSVYGKRQY